MSGGGPRRRWREAQKSVALVVASLLALVLALEIGTRLLTDVPPVVGERDPVIGKRHRRNYSASIFVEEADREVLLRFNREGFRGADVAYDREPDVRRIAVLGDSFVAAVACDEENTAVHRLQAVLEESHPSRRWEVLNFGVSGSSTGQELVLYREVVARYRPDLVLLAYYVGNDFSDNSNRMSSNPRIYFEIDSRGDLVQVPFSATRRTVSAWLNRHSRFYVWQKQANDVLRARTDDGYWIFCTRPGQALEAVWELNERLILTLFEEVESRGGRFVLVLFPSGTQVYDDMWQTVLEQAGRPPGDFDATYPEQRLTAFGRQHGIPVVTMRAEFEEAAGGRSAGDTPAAEQLFFGGRGHFTERGNDLAARIVHRFLTQGQGREILEQVAAEDWNRPQ